MKASKRQALQVIDLLLVSNRSVRGSLDRLRYVSDAIAAGATASELRRTAVGSGYSEAQFDGLLVAITNCADLKIFRTEIEAMPDGNVCIEFSAENPDLFPVLKESMS